jgi:hypothetical protein
MNPAEILHVLINCDELPLGRLGDRKANGWIGECVLFVLRECKASCHQ